MNLSITSIILFSIMVNTCRLSPVPKANISEASSLKHFPEDKKSDIYNNMISSVPKIIVHPNEFNETVTDRTKRSDDNILLSVYHRLRDRQTMGQFSQQNLVNNQHDASNLDHLLWHHINGQNSHPPLPQSASKSLPLNPPITNHAHTLLSQETAHLDPLSVANKPGIKTKGFPMPDNVFIDLLHNQPSIAGSNSFGSLQKIARPYFNSYSAGLVSSVNEMTPSKDCSLLVNMLPVLLVNSFINAITTISNLQMVNSLMIPFVVLSMINFITSFLFIDELCPGSR